MAVSPEALDQRLYSQMMQRLRAFRDGSASLHNLIADLENLSSRLHVADEAWKDEFGANWSQLEDTFSRVVEQQSVLTNDEYRNIVAVVGDMESMLLAVRTWSDEEKEALRKIIEVHRPDLIDDLDAGLQSGFTLNQVREIREAIRAERDENGVTGAGAINQWGAICDDFISRIEPLPT